MDEHTNDEQLVAHIPYSGESIVIDNREGDHTPGAHPGEARIDVDPLVEAFAHSPYDPVIGAMMMGRATGEVVVSPPVSGWMRPIAWMLAILLIVQFPVTLLLPLVSDIEFGLLAASRTLVVSLAFSFGGALMVARLRR